MQKCVTCNKNYFATKQHKSLEKQILQYLAFCDVCYVLSWEISPYHRFVYISHVEKLFHITIRHVENFLTQQSNIGRNSMKWQNVMWGNVSIWQICLHRQRLTNVNVTVCRRRTWKAWRYDDRCASTLWASLTGSSLCWGTSWGGGGRGGGGGKGGEGGKGWKRWNTRSGFVSLMRTAVIENSKSILKEDVEGWGEREIVNKK